MNNLCDTAVPGLGLDLCHGLVIYEDVTGVIYEKFLSNGIYHRM